MRFMAVQGIGYWTGSDMPRSLHILVTGDDRKTVTTLRDEIVHVLDGDRAADLVWQIDQYTQETIGVTLAAEGWEVFSTTEPDLTDDAGPTSSPIYLVRQT